MFQNVPGLEVFEVLRQLHMGRSQREIALVVGPAQAPVRLVICGGCLPGTTPASVWLHGKILFVSSIHSGASTRALG